MIVERFSSILRWKIKKKNFGTILGRKFFFLTNQRKFVSQKAKERTLYANFIKTFLFPFRKGVSNPKSKGQRKLIVGKRIQKFQKKKKLKKQKKIKMKAKHPIIKPTKQI